jgi:MoaA/NifB/PqqE/SkfB family radical SAM enzyme
MINVKNQMKKIIFRPANIIYYRKDIAREDPENLSIFTTSRCNLSCFYCSRNVPDDSSGSINRYDDKGDFKHDDLLLILQKYPGIQHVSFVGIGEPFLNKDLLRMAEYVKQSKISTSVITNGTLLHNFWGNIGPCFDSISISLHGLTAKELTEISGVPESTFEQFVKNIKYLVEVEKKTNPNLKIRASVVFLKENRERVTQAAEFCVQYGITELDIQNYLPISAEDGHNCVFDDEKHHIDFMKNLVNNYQKKLHINMPKYIKRNTVQMNWGCHTFYKTLRVDGLGQISGCTRILPPSSMNGNIHEDINVWNNEYYRNMRKKFRIKKGIPDTCRYCPDAQ